MKYQVIIEQAGDTFEIEVEADSPSEATMKAANMYKGEVSTRLANPEE